MNKVKNIVIASITTILTLGAITTNKVKADNSLPTKHLILNKDNSYGGSYDVIKYGLGAPLNGELDHKDSIYFKTNDYYNAYNTDTRLIVRNFSPYQQRFANSDGIACCLMVMNHFGYTDRRIYSEERLVSKYETLNNANLSVDKVNPEGLKKLLNSYGLIAKTTSYTSNKYEYADIYNFIDKSINNDELILMPFTGNNGYQWYVVLGYDKCKEDIDNDDILILADPFDAFDHYQDGYSIFQTKVLRKYWKDIKAGSVNDGVVSFIEGENVTVKAPKGFKLDLTKGKETFVKNTNKPQKHLLLNYDGTYGGTLDTTYYGIPTKSIGSGGNLNGENTDREYSLYYTTNDYYNLGNTETRTLLTNYKMYQQSCSSTCGISSTLAALVHLGIPYDPTNKDVNDYSCVNEFKLMMQYESLTGNTIYNSGVGQSGLRKVVAKYNAKVLTYSEKNHANVLSGSSSRVYNSYQDLINGIKGALDNKIPFLMSWNAGSGHWETIIGYDNMGTESVFDDVAIFADSHDVQDHYCDGYNTWSLTFVLNHWYNGSFKYLQQGYTFEL